MTIDSYFSLEQLTLIKKQFFTWINQSFDKNNLPKNLLSKFSRTLSHENLHVMIFYKFTNESKITFTIEYITENGFVTYKPYVTIYYPIRYDQIKYYPKIVLITLIQAIYDIIQRIYLRQFTRILPIIKKLLRIIITRKI